MGLKLEVRCVLEVVRRDGVWVVCVRCPQNAREPLRCVEDEDLGRAVRSLMPCYIENATIHGLISAYTGVKTCSEYRGWFA